MIIGLIVDNPKRDLAGLALLSHELAKRGVQTVLVPLYQQGSDVPLLRLDALLLNYARSNNRALMEGYKAHGLPLFVLDTEGGVLSEDGADAPHIWAASVRESGFGELIDGYFFWGARTCDAFTRHSGIDPDKLHVTGCPRYDLCAPPWRSLLGYHSRDYILVNTHYSSVNPRFTASAEGEKEVMRGVGWAADYVDRLFADTDTQFHACLRDLVRLAADNPDRSFLLRPHPFERQEPYEQAFAHLDNVVVDPSGNVLNVIRNARCVIHLGCSTAIESTLLGRVPISMEYLITPFLRQHAPVPSRVSVQADSFEALDRAVKSIDEVTAAHDFAGIHHREIEPWFHLADGAAAARVADHLVAAIPARGSGQRKVSLARSLASGHQHPSALQRFQGTVNLALGSRIGTSARCLLSPQRRHKRFGPMAVKTWLTGYQKAEHRNGPLERVGHARHPLHGLPLESIIVQPAASGDTA